MNAPNGVMYHISGSDGIETVSVYVPDKGLNQAFSTNPNYAKILELARAGDHSVVDLFDLSLSVQKAVEQYQDYTDRVSVANGQVFFDREVIDNSLTEYILRLLESNENFLPWMRFMEKLQTNPQPESRDMLFDFLRANQVTLTPEGDLVCYKGVQSIDGIYRSLNSGTAIVDGKTITGTIPYPIGSTVTMPRSEVQFDPDNACSTGLHVATRSFAESYGRSGVVLEVHVNPRDVVSVPNDARGEKVRVSRLYVAGINEKRIEEPVKYDEDFEGWEGDEDRPGFSNPMEYTKGTRTTPPSREPVVRLDEALEDEYSESDGFPRESRFDNDAIRDCSYDARETHKRPRGIWNRLTGRRHP